MKQMDPRTPTPDHRRAWDLIPWVVAGSASPAEQALVHTHAATCADCRDELAFHRGVRAGMLDAPPADAADDARAGAALQRLWARVDAPEAAPSSRRWPRWGVAAAAVIALQALGLATLGGMLWERPRAVYQTLSQPAPASAATIRFVPAPAMLQAELQALLARHRLQVVEVGADAAHYGLAPLPGAADGGPDATQRLARLRAEPGVLLAEPVGSGR